MRGQGLALQANQWFFPKRKQKKNWVSGQTWCTRPFHWWPCWSNRKQSCSFLCYHRLFSWIVQRLSVPWRYRWWRRVGLGWGHQHGGSEMRYQNRCGQRGGSCHRPTYQADRWTTKEVGLRPGGIFQTRWFHSQKCRCCNLGSLSHHCHHHNRRLRRNKTPFECISRCRIETGSPHLCNSE